MHKEEVTKIKEGLEFAGKRGKPTKVGFEFYRHSDHDFSLASATEGSGASGTPGFAGLALALPTDAEEGRPVEMFGFDNRLFALDGCPPEPPEFAAPLLADEDSVGGSSGGGR